MLISVSRESTASDGCMCLQNRAPVPISADSRQSTVGVAGRTRREGVTEWEIRQTDCKKLAAALRKLESKVQDPEAQGSLLGMATSVQSPVQN